MLAWAFIYFPLPKSQMERHLNCFNRSIYIHESHLEGLDLDPSACDIVQSKNTIGNMEELGIFTNIESCHSWSTTS